MVKWLISYYKKYFVVYIIWFFADILRLPYVGGHTDLHRTWDEEDLTLTLTLSLTLSLTLTQTSIVLGTRKTDHVAQVASLAFDISNRDM